MPTTEEGAFKTPDGKELYTKTWKVRFHPIPSTQSDADDPAHSQTPPPSA